MITPILRLKLSDFLSTEYEADVLSKLHEINNLDYFTAFPVYLWYDRDNDKVDLSRLKDFIVKWEETGEFRKMYEFTVREKPNRKQKRNDYEDSNHR